ncbi:Uncharacterised protein [Mycobacteroides abscessus subsp. abscessus]|nr:Uncharacterised protein [Mycobacteroides abscessus subsp. abscessus]
MMTTTTPVDVRVVRIDDRDALRAHLDRLNEAGIGCSAAGVAGNGEPFMIELSGCYVETETVLWGDPWAGDIEHSSGVRCEDCGAHNLYGIDSLQFPVHIITTVR